MEYLAEITSKMQWSLNCFHCCIYGFIYHDIRVDANGEILLNEFSYAECRVDLGYWNTQISFLCVVDVK